MKIESFVLEQCYAHGIAAYPDEACGLISGPIDQEELLSEVHQMHNLMDVFHLNYPIRYPRTNRDGYLIDPLEQMRLEELLAQQGQRVKIAYHSHADAEAYFSETDIKYALYEGEPIYPGLQHLVCSIKDSQPAGCILAMFNPITKAFDAMRIE